MTEALATPALYSQGLEQPAILAALEGITGRYLEIGGFHAKQLSNTRALFELGWSGVVFEPSPGPLKGLIEEYGKEDRVIVVSAAVASERGMAQFFVTDDATSTTDADHFRKWSRICNFYGSFFVPTVTIADIRAQWGDFDFVSIDAESTSAELFRQLLATDMRPKCICVEFDNQLNELEGIAASKGYTLTFQNGENAVFSL